MVEYIAAKVMKYAELIGKPAASRGIMRFYRRSLVIITVGATVLIEILDWESIE